VYLVLWQNPTNGFSTFSDYPRIFLVKRNSESEYSASMSCDAAITQIKTE